MSFLKRSPSCHTTDKVRPVILQTKFSLSYLGRSPIRYLKNRYLIRQLHAAGGMTEKEASLGVWDSIYNFSYILSSQNFTSDQFIFWHSQHIKTIMINAHQSKCSKINSFLLLRFCLFAISICASIFSSI